MIAEDFPNIKIPSGTLFTGIYANGEYSRAIKDLNIKQSLHILGIVNSDVNITLKESMKKPAEITRKIIDELGQDYRITTVHIIYIDINGGYEIGANNSGLSIESLEKNTKIMKTIGEEEKKIIENLNENKLKISLFHETIGIFTSTKSDIKISLPTKGMPMNGDPAVFETYPNELYQITPKGEISKINTPFIEIACLDVSPVENKLMVTGTLPDGNPKEEIVEIDLDTKVSKEIFSYINSDKTITSDHRTTMDYSKDGKLYFDILEGRVPHIYAYDGEEVTLIRLREASRRSLPMVNTWHITELTIFMLKSKKSQRLWK